MSKPLLGVVGMYKGNLLRRWRALAGMVLVAGAVAGCATAPVDDPEALAEFKAINDPLEPLNRQIFAVNVALDTFVLQPVAVTYRDFMFPPLKNNIRALLTNLRLPWTFVNNLLQGDLPAAENTASRFVSNMLTLWMADLGADEDSRQEDFGQTLAVWGVENGGPYIMLPLLGPANVRDASGRVVDFVGDPVRFATSREISVARAASGAVDGRSRNIEDVQDLQANSLDFYATVRSLYRQRRASVIENEPFGTLGPAPTISITDDDDEREPESSAR